MPGDYLPIIEDDRTPIDSEKEEKTGAKTARRDWEETKERGGSEFSIMGEEDDEEGRGGHVIEIS